jgi:hypothetical protein
MWGNCQAKYLVKSLPHGSIHAFPPTIPLSFLIVFHLRAAAHMEFALGANLLYDPLAARAPGCTRNGAPTSLPRLLDPSVQYVYIHPI